MSTIGFLCVLVVNFLLHRIILSSTGTYYHRFDSPYYYLFLEISQHLYFDKTALQMLLEGVEESLCKSVHS